jgi:EpsI family protein
MLARILTLSSCLFAAAAYLSSATTAEVTPARRSLADFPIQMAEWTGERLPDFEPGIVAVLGVDEYVNLTYARDRTRDVGLYIGYYASQRQGDAIHSPMNCLPGAGWQPLSHSYLTIPIEGAAPIAVNRYIIEKDAARMVVLYWYQSHGRVVANEYRSKALMVYDAIRLNRTDAALIRVVSPVLPGDPDDGAAGAHAVEFVQDMFPTLDAYLPS